MLRRDDIYGLVGVHVDVAAAGQLGGQAGADDLGAVQAEDRIDHGGGGVVPHQLLRDGAGFGQAGLLHRHINIIIDVAVAGGKMTFGHTQQQIFLFGGQLDQIHGHGGITPSFAGPGPFLLYIYFKVFCAPAQPKRGEITTNISPAFLAVLPVCAGKTASLYTAAGQWYNG